MNILLNLVVVASLVFLNQISGAEPTCASRAYLQQMPLDRIIDIYTNHEDAVANPRLRDYAEFFQTHRALFEEIIRSEEAESDENYVLYHGANGMRLVFDLLRAISQSEHGAEVPNDFVFFRDERDPEVLVDDLCQLLTARWPLIHDTEKIVVLTALLDCEITNEQAILLWDILWGDLNENEDLRPDQRALLAPLLDHPLDKLLPVFHALRSELAFEELTGLQRQQVDCIQQTLRRRGQGHILLKMQLLHDAYDFDTDFRQKNMAVNLSLFSGAVLRDRKVGLYPAKDECSPLYWFAPDLGPHQYADHQLLRRVPLEAILQRHHIPPGEIEAIELIYSELEQVDDQLLLQIFVPKVVTVDSQGGAQPLIDQILYLSHKIGRPAYYLRGLRPSELLEIYRENPSHIPGFLQLQGRLVFTKQGLMNAESGIRVRTYYLPGASPRRIAAYLQRLDRWANRVIRDRSVSPQAVSPMRFAKSVANIG